MEQISLKSWDVIEESDKEYIFKRAILISNLDLFVQAANDILDCEIPLKDFSREVITDRIKAHSSLKSIAESLKSYQAKAQEVFTQHNDEKASESEMGAYIKCGAYFLVTSCISLPIAYYFGSAELFELSLFIPTGASAVTLNDYSQQVEDSKQIKNAMKVICDRAKL